MNVANNEYSLSKNRFYPWSITNDFFTMDKTKFAITNSLIYYTDG